MSRHREKSQRYMGRSKAWKPESISVLLTVIGELGKKFWMTIKHPSIYTVWTTRNENLRKG